jgi:hypothetical protein
VKGGFLSVSPLPGHVGQLEMALAQGFSPKKGDAIAFSDKLYVRDDWQ